MKLLFRIEAIIGDRHDSPDSCLLYTSDAADEEDSVDLGGRRIIKNNFLFFLLIVLIHRHS